jgi:hypothetical protein
MSQVDASDRLPEHLWALEQSLLDPTTRTDADSIAELLADDFIEFGSSGRVWSKAATISQLAGERPDASVQRSVANRDVRFLSADVALLTYALSRRSPLKADVKTLRSSVWTRAEGKWRMTFHQGTVVPPSSE